MLCDYAMRTLRLRCCNCDGGRPNLARKRLENVGALWYPTARQMAETGVSVVSSNLWAICMRRSASARNGVIP